MVKVRHGDILRILFGLAPKKFSQMYDSNIAATSEQTIVKIGVMTKTWILITLQRTVMTMMIRILWKPACKTPKRKPLKGRGKTPATPKVGIVYTVVSIEQISSTLIE